MSEYTVRSFKDCGTYTVGYESAHDWMPVKDFDYTPEGKGEALIYAKRMNEPEYSQMNKEIERLQAEVDRLKEKQKEACCLLSDVKHYREKGVRIFNSEWSDRLNKFLEVKS